MLYLLLGAAILVFLLWPRAFFLKGDGWRVGAGAASIAAFAAAAYATIRGSWGTGIVLGVVALWSVTEARRRPIIRREIVHPPKSELSLSEARALLGVGPGGDPGRGQGRLYPPDPDGPSRQGRHRGPGRPAQRRAGSFDQAARLSYD
jgi:hypothetical protein